MSTSTSNKQPGHLDDILLSVQSIPAVGGSLNCLFDNAATCSLITETAAKTLNLVGEKIMMEICTVNGRKTIDSAIYHVPLIDSTNKKHIVVAHQVKAISDGLAKVYLSGVKNLFSPSVQDKWESVTSRPTWSVDLLVGLDFMRLYHIELERQDNLRIVQSLFAKGLILVGSHQLLKSSNLGLSENVAAIRHYAQASINRVSIHSVYN